MFADKPIRVERWPSETPLLVLTAIAAAFMWVVIVVSVIGLIYAVMLALVFGLMQMMFVSHVRGNGVRLGPEQFPELHDAVHRMAARMDLNPVPEIFIMQAGGALNAFATRFLRTHLVVLFTDLLEACGDSKGARDMIIAHELGHIKERHLRFHWYLLPGYFIPFLGAALSRAREYTCDRYGLAGAGDKEGAGLGLAILAAGATHGPLLNRKELVRQRTMLSRSGFMTAGEWFASHPPLAKRLAEIDPELAAGAPLSSIGAQRAAASVVAIPMAMGVVFALVMSLKFGDKLREFAETAAVQQAGSTQGETETYVAPPDAAERAVADINRLVAFLEAERKRGALPWNVSELYRRLSEEYPRSEMPSDPFDGSDYGYDQRGTHYMVWSSGPDAASWTPDDIRYDSRLGRIVGGPAAGAPESRAPQRPR